MIYEPGLMVIGTSERQAWVWRIATRWNIEHLEWQHKQRLAALERKIKAEKERHKREVSEFTEWVDSQVSEWYKAG